jgi:predicted hotdog family 3-hydroxylacyl-ACP dehydratase
MLINKENIQSYLPQRPPFVMIDALIETTESTFESAFEVIESNIFIENGVLSESALVENIAQTCAAGFGYVGSQNGEEAGKLGFIGAVSKLKVSGLPKTGDKLATKIEILNTFDAIHLIQGTVYENDTELLTCQMKIVIA